MDIQPKAIDALRLDTQPVRPLQGEAASSPDLNLDPRFQLFIEPRSVAGECFRMLRAKILAKKTGPLPRSIMVTSPQPMDGKTTVAANLAASIARGINEHVLLVDCDLRRPAMATMFGINADQGIREYLEHGDTIEPYLMKTPIPKLTLLPSGKPPVNPSELLSSDKMKTLVRELKMRYEDRFVVFDATPAQFGAETTFLASMVDAVLLVVRYGKTPRDLIAEAIENIGPEKILGIVFNATQRPPKGYQYYYRYYRKQPD
ncbi:MAG: CpsD/CapB family tyrosine-protein kinase [Deltaproteobacteria bacterium]|nr:CpsD/CapB family tyrosine-protein kinase [Deltaproteobacteria bacterium]